MEITRTWRLVGFEFYRADVVLVLKNHKGIEIKRGVGSTSKRQSELGEKKDIQNLYMVAVNNAMKDIFSDADLSWLAKLPRGEVAYERADKNVFNSGISNRPVAGSGTGFLVDNEGRLLTAHHVVKDCNALSIVYKDVEYPVSLIARDSYWDVALLKGNISNPESADLAFPEKVKTGIDVIAFGFPLQSLLAPTPSLTKGVLSNDEVIKGHNDMVQTTAPIQPGNSGGPLIDMSGKVVGMTVATLNSTLWEQLHGRAAYQNMNYAVSSSRLDTFLKVNNVKVSQKTNSETYTSVEIADQAKQYTVIVLCRK